MSFQIFITVAHDNFTSRSLWWTEEILIKEQCILWKLHSSLFRPHLFHKPSLSSSVCAIDWPLKCMRHIWFSVYMWYLHNYYVCACFCWFVVFWHGNLPSICSSENENAPENYTIKLLPMSETFDFDRGLLLAVQAIQVGTLKTILLLIVH